jgi:hypothetical protein
MCANVSADTMEPSIHGKIKLWECKKYKTPTPFLG